MSISEPPEQINAPVIAPAFTPQLESPSGNDRRTGNAIAFFASMVFHIAMLLVLALVAFTSGKDSNGILINAEVGQSIETTLEELQTFDVSVNESLEPNIESDPEFKMDVEVETPVDLGVGEKMMLTSATVDQVIENLKPMGNGRGANFFGAYAEGNQFIYVLDSSRSMKGERWTYACQKLLDSLNGLKEEQEFYVICFDLGTTFLFNQEPKRAKYYKPTDENIRRVKNWLRSRTLGAATMPAEGLHYALEFNPDAIFMLSDGELQDNSLQMLRQINSVDSDLRQIPIHTVHLMSEFGRETLEIIAKENQGTFTPIEGNKPFGRFRRR